MPFHHGVAHREFIHLAIRLIKSPWHHACATLATHNLHIHIGASKRLRLHDKVLGSALGGDAQREIVDLVVCPACGRGEFVVDPERVSHAIRFVVGIGVAHNVDAWLEMRLETIHIGVFKRRFLVGFAHKSIEITIGVFPLALVNGRNAVGQALFRKVVGVWQIFPIHLHHKVVNGRVRPHGQLTVAVEIGRLCLKTHQNIGGWAIVAKLVVHLHVGEAVVGQIHGQHLFRHGNVGVLNGHQLIATGEVFTVVSRSGERDQQCY